MCTEIPNFRRSCEYLRTDRPGHGIEKSKSAQNSKWREFERREPTRGFRAMSAYPRGVFPRPR